MPSQRGAASVRSASHAFGGALPALTADHPTSNAAFCSVQPRPNFPRQMARWPAAASPSQAFLVGLESGPEAHMYATEWHDAWVQTAASVFAQVSARDPIAQRCPP